MLLGNLFCASFHPWCVLWPAIWLVESVLHPSFAYLFFFCLHTLSSCTHYLAALLTTVVVEEKIWKTWVLWVTSRTYPEKWIVTCVGYARVTSAVHFCILAPAQRRCVFSCWWMGHTANKQYLQPSVRSGVNAGDIVQHRGIYPEA